MYGRAQRPAADRDRARTPPTPRRAAAGPDGPRAAGRPRRPATSRSPSVAPRTTSVPAAAPSPTWATASSPPPWPARPPPSSATPTSRTPTPTSPTSAKASPSSANTPTPPAQVWHLPNDPAHPHHPPAGRHRLPARRPTPDQSSAPPRRSCCAPSAVANPTVRELRRAAVPVPGTLHRRQQQDRDQARRPRHPARPGPRRHPAGLPRWLTRISCGRWGPPHRTPTSPTGRCSSVPRGFLVAILTDADEAERAAAALRAAGFADRPLRIFTSEQILDDYARYTAQQSRPRRVVAAITDDQDTLDLYHGHARDGRASPSGSTSPTTTRPTARSAASPTAPRCTSGTTGTADRATSISSDPRRRSGNARPIEPPPREHAMTEPRTPYPVRVDASLDPSPSRGLWLVKWLLLIPHVHRAVLPVGRVRRRHRDRLLRDPVHRALSAVAVRLQRRRHALVLAGALLRLRALGTDRYPPFTLDEVPDYPAHLDVAYPERLSRGLIFVKWLLAIPQFVVVAVFVGGGLWLGTRGGGRTTLGQRRQRRLEPGRPARADRRDRAPVHRPLPEADLRLRPRHGPVGTTGRGVCRADDRPLPAVPARPGRHRPGLACPPAHSSRALRGADRRRRRLRSPPGGDVHSAAPA